MTDDPLYAKYGSGYISRDRVCLCHHLDDEHEIKSILGVVVIDNNPVTRGTCEACGCPEFKPGGTQVWP